MPQIIERPIGHKLGQSYNVSIFQDGDDAVFTQPVSMVNGEWIYIKGFVENYNGFWQVSKKSGTLVALLDPNPLIGSGTDLIPFVVNADVTVYKTFDHNWSCVHLPIVYEISNDKFPINQFDSSINITSASNENGYTLLHLTTPYVNPKELEYLTMVYSPDGITNISGVFQIIEVQSDSLIVINLIYNSISTYLTVLKYYNNYHLIVNVFAGINPDKPYELSTQLKFIPDSNNVCSFSINEILKSSIEIENNTLLATLPKDINSFTEFFIQYAEAFDVSEFPYAVEINVDEGELIQDSFIGVAVNSMLEFKNVYSGYMSDYIVESNLTGSRFLTLFNKPTIFDGKYFDISFLISDDLPHYLFKISTDSAGNYISYMSYLISQIHGLYRFELFKIGSESYQNILIVTTVYKISAPSSWISGAGGGAFDYDTRNATQLIANAAGSPKTFRAYQLLSFPSTIKSISIPITVVVSGSFNVGALNVTMIPADASGTQLSAISVGSLGGGFLTVGNYNVILTIGENYVSITDGVTTVTQSSVQTVFTNIKRLYFQTITPSTPSSGSVTITVPVGQVISYDDTLVNSETKVIKVNALCENHSIYLTWLNNLGGYDYWDFTDGSDFIRNIKESGETKTNIFPNWPRSYGENASEIRKQIYRISNKGILVRAQHITLEDLQAIEYLKSSILVEIVNSRSDKRRVIVDTNSWTSYKDIDKLYTLSFTLEYTNDIPAQRL